MKNKEYRIFYLLSLALIVLLSAYPIYMGVKVAIEYLTNGFIFQANYPKYVIPYTPMCIAIIVSAALIPLFYRYARRATQIISSAAGIGVFFASEWLFEQIEVLTISNPWYIDLTYNDYVKELIQSGSKNIEILMPVDSWQLGLCAATPEVLISIGKPSYTDNNPAYKVHFYIIAILIIVCTVGILCGFTKMIHEERREMKKSLLMQTVALALFIGLCVLACFTAFYRNGTIYISPLSSFLTGLFFIVFGVTFGLFIAGFVYSKKPWIAYILPALSACVMTVVMYIGELVLMGGEVFRFGLGAFFSPIGVFPLSPCDVLIILVSGVIALIMTGCLRATKSKNSVETQ